MQETIKAKLILGIPLTAREQAFWLLFVATDEEVAHALNNTTMDA